MTALESIPPPEVVRVELARAVREADRLRALLKLSVRTEEDRRFFEELRGQRSQQESRS